MLQHRLQSPIFVVGPPRSGTTLTAKILGRHSRVFMPGETHYFEDIYENRRYRDSLYRQEVKEEIFQRLMTIYARYDELADQDRIDAIYANRESSKETTKHSWKNHKDIFTSFMESQMHFENKVRWGNNVPRDIFYMRELVQFFPRAKFVVCMRDSRDFMVSYKERWKTASKTHAKRIKRIYHPVITSLLWKASAKAMLKVREIVPSGSYYYLKYENLVRQPEAEVRKICDMLEEEYEPEMLQIDSNNSSVNKHKKGIFTSSVGRWRGALDDGELYIMQAIGGKQLRELGYKQEDVKFDRSKVLGYFAALPYVFVNTVIETREMRGPIIPYLIRRWGMLK